MERLPALRLLVTALVACGLASGAGLPAAARATASVDSANTDAAHSCRASGPAAEAIRPIVEQHARNWLGPDTPGMTIAIVEPDPTTPGTAQTLVFSCGVTDTTSGTPTVPETLYEIGSETKLFTATAFARQLLGGALGLDDELRRFLPDTSVPPEATCDHPADQSPITLRDLATHNSGLLEDPKNPTWDKKTNPEGRKDYTRADLLASFTDGLARPCDALRFRPGTRYSYSDWGYALLGLVTADRFHATDDTPAVGPMIDALVTSPLGMTNTRLEPDIPPPGMATPTCRDTDPPCWFDNNNAYAGAGGLISDIDDMATFVRASLGYDRASPVWPAIDLTHQPAGIGQGDIAGRMGLGWEIYPAGSDARFPDLMLLDKDGTTNGMNSHTVLAPEVCFGVTLLSNSRDSSAVGFDGVAGAILRDLAPRGRSDACAGPRPVTLRPAFTG